MNVYDSAKMADILMPFGYKQSDTITDSDLIILNTCHIREKATEKVYSELGRIKEMQSRRKTRGKDTIIVVAGCVGQAEGEEIFARAPFVDIVVGPQSYQTLPKLMGKVVRNKKSAINIDFPMEDKFDKLPEESSPQGISAFLTIQEGCDKFCKFCCVPYTRGAEFSRPVNEIFREALQIANNGSLEITLLGQNVSAYHGVDIDNKEVSLARLIHEISKIKSIKRIRYTTSHPRDMQDDLIEIHGTEPKLMPFIHLPVQSGSDRILKHMNRKHTAEQYIDLIQKFRAARTDIAFSSDFIVGYPGETEEDFEATMLLVSEVKFAQAYSFKYSPRPGTPASVYKDQISDEIKSDRLQRLQALIRKQQHDFNAGMLGKTMDILFEKKGKHAGQYIGKSNYMQSVYAQSTDDLIGKIAKVKIVKIDSNSLGGELVTTTKLELAS
jgi:tRNA-2-methylthio-N6-dimethylallyladenosine synthase